ncbi:CDI toxin immunity protein [Paludifilum halophilum]|uniref:Uncharacterized protein n=1 Tax=Paludifilum halophilum TaxID=1642702 RepID=A0A235B3P9_9BACL|nr:hypothetical protein [Paludifilum halophilum]OYD06537.1 hypothetical protein CHM34_15685 [Paludifilum halophilum]
MTLFEECLDALGEHCEVLSEEKSNRVVEAMCRLFPVAINGRIDWDKVRVKKEIEDLSEISGFTNTVHDEALYLIWSDGSYPVVQSKMKNVMEAIDDITAVSFDTWLFNPTSSFVIEFYHEGEIIYGKHPQDGEPLEC